MKIEHPDGRNNVDLKGKFLWKYLDLYKLIELVTSQSLYFQRFDKFEDGLEGLTGEAIFQKFATKGNPLTKENINKSFDEELQSKLIQDDKSRRHNFSELVKKIQQTQFGSCWFLNDKESLSMWKIYAENNGLALKFNASQLTETVLASASSYVNTDFQIMYYGKVDYKNIWPFDADEKYEGRFTGLKKDNSYISENEFRFVTVTNPKKIGEFEYFKLPIGNLADFDFKIILSPFLEPWKSKIVQNILSKYNLEKKISESSMDIKNNYG